MLTCLKVTYRALSRALKVHCNHAKRYEHPLITINAIQGEGVICIGMTLISNTLKNALRLSSS
jgi:hypothetical protein